MKKINYLKKCYPGFKYLPHARQEYYSELLPVNQLYIEYKTAHAEKDEDALLLLEFQHKRHMRNLKHLFAAINQEIAFHETHWMLERYCFGFRLLHNNEKDFLARSTEFQQMKTYIQKLFIDLENKYVNIIEENNAYQGWFSDCRRIPPDKILSDFENERMNLKVKIRIGLQDFISHHENKLFATDFTRHVKRMTRSIQNHYAKKVNQLFIYFPALMRINIKNHNRLYPHFATILRETDREIFNETSDLNTANALIIRGMAMECYYLLDELTASMGYAIDLQEFNRQYAYVMAKTIYESHQKKHRLKLNLFIKNYEDALLENIINQQKIQLSSFISKYDNRMGYTRKETLVEGIHQMWSYTISSQPAKVAGLFITKFLDAMGFLQSLNLSTENDIALFFVATHATRMSEDLSHIKRLLFAIGRMLFGTIRHELFEASLEPNPRIREFKLAAILLFYTAMITLAAVALSLTAFMTLLAGFEFIAIPIAIIAVIAAATLVTKVTFYLINAYQEWKQFSINPRMQDALGFPLAKEVATLYQSAFKSVDIMLAHLNEKTGLTHQALDFKVELEKLKINLKNEWKLIRNDKNYPIDNIKKIITHRIKYLYDKEKCCLLGKLRSEITHRFGIQRQSFLSFCTDAKKHALLPYQLFSQNKNEIIFFKKRTKKLKNILDMLENQHYQSSVLKTEGFATFNSFF